MCIDIKAMLEQWEFGSSTIFKLSIDFGQGFLKFGLQPCNIQGLENITNSLSLIIIAPVKETYNNLLILLSHPFLSILFSGELNVLIVADYKVMWLIS